MTFKAVPPDQRLGRRSFTGPAVSMGQPIMEMID
jgi:hypothetical protein